MMRDNAMTADP